MKNFDTEVDYDELEYDNDIRAYVIDGKRFNGVAIERLSNGGLLKSMIIGGLQNGTSREWYPSGAQKSEENYLANSLHGICWEWNPEGILVKESIYEYGIKTKEILYDQQGTLLQQYELEASSSQFSILSLLRKTKRQKFGME